jgi:hypothetical protein
LTSSPTTIESYFCNLSERFAACCEIAMQLVSKPRAWHHELVNSCWHDPRVYNSDDIVFARVAIWSDASKSCVGKLKFFFTGPWRVIGSADGGSHNIDIAITLLGA